MRNILFLHTARKLRAVRPAGEKPPSHFTLLVEKISICTTGVSKQSLGSPLARATIMWDLSHSLLLLLRCIIYYFHRTLAESTTFALGSEMRMWYFRPGYDEKSYTQHEDKEGHPRAPVCEFTRALDWPNLPPLLCNILIPPATAVARGKVLSRLDIPDFSLTFHAKSSYSCTY